MGGPPKPDHQLPGRRDRALPGERPPTPRSATCVKGMVDLLAAKLTGTGGLRAAEPRTVLSAWRHAGGAADRELAEGDALGLSRSLGAGRLIQGSVVGSKPVGSPSRPRCSTWRRARRSPTRMSMAPRTVSPRCSTGCRPSSSPPWPVVRGSPRSPCSTSLPALQAYLDGVAAYRRGRYVDAGRALNQVPSTPISTFAAAAYDADGSQWVGGRPGLRPGRSSCWAPTPIASLRGIACCSWGVERPQLPAALEWRRAGRGRRAGGRRVSRSARCLVPPGRLVLPLRHDVAGLPDAFDRSLAAFGRAMLARSQLLGASRAHHRHPRHPTGHGGPGARSARGRERLGRRRSPALLPVAHHGGDGRFRGSGATAGDAGSPPVPGDADRGARGPAGWGGCRGPRPVAPRRPRWTPPRPRRRRSADSSPPTVTPV